MCAGLSGEAQGLFGGRIVAAHALEEGWRIKAVRSAGGLAAEPQWSFSRFVGMVGSHTLENIVIDNSLFGVASVSVDGYESPVVFPGATGSFGGY